MNIEINQELSKNIIANFKIKKKIEPDNNYNIISCVFFKKKNMYKDFNIYINGLKQIIITFIKLFPSYRLRIYYDKSVLDILNNILNNNKNSNIELYQYYIKVLSEDDIYHKGTIGTFIRFLPLFDLEYHKVDKCIIFDIDNTLHNFYKQIINNLEINNIKFAYRCRFCYIMNKRIIYSKIKFPIIASFIYQSFQMPYKIFSTFIEKLYIENNVKIIKFINKCDIYDIYEYGMDELFLNKYYLKYINKKNINYILILINHIDIFGGFKDMLLFYSKKRKTTLIIWNIIKIFFKIINIDLNQYYEENYNNDEINNELILEILKKNNKLIELNLKKYISNPKLKKFILNEIKKKYSSKKINIFLNCILNNLRINAKKINMVEIENNNIKKHYYLNFK